MKTVHSMREALDRKNGSPCPACLFPHDPKVLCSREAMATRISRLTEANSGIPNLLSANKELAEICQALRMMLKKADEAHTVLMELLSEHGEEGNGIAKEYMRRLDEWAQGKGHTNQDTCDLQPSLFSQEHLTSGASETSDSTKLQSGTVSENDS